MAINAASSLVTPHSGTVISLAESKLHLRVDASSEDALITSLIDAATQDAEHLMQRAILPQQWALRLDEWPAEVSLPRPTVSAVTSIAYIDTAGAAQTINPATCILSTSDLRARLLPAYGTSWPAARNQPGAITVTYTCGWANAAAVPELVKAWIKLRLTALYEHRSAWTQGAAIEPNPHVDFLLDRWRLYTL